MSKMFFIDTTLCTACRGCQIACKEWKELDAIKTRQLGTHQNPPDLNACTLKLVRFSEAKINGQVVWNFFSDQCRHCINPPCKEAGDGFVPDAIFHDPATGAVVYTPKTKEFTAEAFDAVWGSCPFDIPRKDEATGLAMKCDMCFDRVSKGLPPMCAKTCPTRAIRFGEAAEMQKLAKERLDEIKKQFPDASILDADSVRVLYLIAYKQEYYTGKKVASRSPEGMTRKQMLSKLGSPITRTLDRMISS